MINSIKVTDIKDMSGQKLYVAQTYPSYMIISDNSILELDYCNQGRRTAFKIEPEKGAKSPKKKEETKTPVKEKPGS